MEGFINGIKSFIWGLTPTVRILLVGLFVIFSILSFITVVKTYANAKSYSGLKIGSIIFTILFLGIAVFIAAV